MVIIRAEFLGKLIEKRRQPLLDGCRMRNLTAEIWIYNICNGKLLIGLNMLFKFLRCIVLLVLLYLVERISFSKFTHILKRQLPLS